MILGTICTLLALGLVYRSLLFELWVLFLLAPSWLMMVRIFEERELEIRFGDAYRAYRARTPMFFPRRPSTRDRAGRQRRR